MSDSEEDVVNKQVKIVILGDSSVGKTSIVKRFCYDEFYRQYVATVGADFYMKRKMLAGQREVVLKITDVGGQELTGNMLDKYLYGVDIIILIYDITCLSSFESLINWLNRVTKPANVAIIGNKCDMEHQRAVRLDRNKQLVEEHGLMGHCTVSARTGESITSAIMNLVAKNLGVVLSKAEQERQQRVVRAELAEEILPHKVPPTARPQLTSSGICTVQ